MVKKNAAKEKNLVCRHAIAASYVTKKSAFYRRFFVAKKENMLYCKSMLKSGAGEKKI